MDSSVIFLHKKWSGIKCILFSSQVAKGFWIQYVIRKVWREINSTDELICNSKAVARGKRMQKGMFGNTSEVNAYIIYCIQHRQLSVQNMGRF